MPTIFSHGIFASWFSNIWANKTGRWKVMILVILASIIPDLDVLTIKFGIPHSHPYGHRGFTHSLFFAGIIGLIFTIFFYSSIRNKKDFIILFIIFFLSTASHGFLDAATNGGAGVCFYCPFETKRYFLPYRPIRVSPIGLNFFSEAGLKTILSEIYFVWIPTIGLYLVFYIFAKIRKRNEIQ